MQTIKSRIAALETANQDDGLKVVFLEDGQSEAEALQFAGLHHDARGIVWCSQIDEML